MDWGTVIVAVISAIGLDRLVVYLLELGARRRKAEAEADVVKAEATNKTLEGAFRLIDTLTQQVKTLGQRLDEQECEIRSLRKLVARYAQRIEYLMQGIRVLLGQLEEQKVAPCWQPDEWTPEEDDD